MPLAPDERGIISGSLDLLTQDYQSKAIDQNNSQLTNLYLEPDKSRGKYQIIAYSMPGTEQFADTGEANIRALLELNGTAYVVTGNKFGTLASNGTFTQLGPNLNTSSGFAQMKAISGASDTNNQIIIIDGTNGYTYNIGTSTATFPITDVDFPQDCTALDTLHEYVIVQKKNSISYQISNVADSTSWDALDFASKVAQPDQLVTLCQHQDRLWLFGNRTTEVWWDSGNTDFPLEKIGDVFIHHGCAARQSVILVSEMLYFLGQDKSGGTRFIQMNQFTPVDITTPPIANELESLTTPSDCIASRYSRDGHEFIDWTFPTDAKTFTYDVTTGIWSRRKSLISASYTRFRGQFSIFCYGKSLIGDYNSGKIYSQDTSIYQDNGQSLLRQFVSPPLYKDGKRIFISRLQIDVQTGIGSNKTFDLEISNDSGRTWTAINTFTVPDDVTTQSYTTSLGSAFNWMIRITTTMNADFSLLGCIANIRIGQN